MQIGNIVAYKSSGKLQIGLISEEKGKKIILKNNEGKNISINSEKIDFIIEQNDNKNKDDEFIKDTFSNLVMNSQKINLAEIYDVVKDETDGLSLKDIAELIFIGDYDNKQLFSLYYALSDNNIYFKQKNEIFVPKKKEEVEERLKQIQIAKDLEEKEKQEIRNSYIWLKAYFNFYYNTYKTNNEEDEEEEEQSESNTKKTEQNDKQNDEGNYNFTFPPNVPEIVSKMIEPIRLYAVFGDRSEYKSEATELMKNIKKKTQFKMVSSQYESAFKFLIELGIFEEDENISLLKYNVPISAKEEALKLAEGIEEFKYNHDKEPHRMDLRSHFVYTIDDEYTKDIDDGLSIEKTERGYKVYIHIADVSYYINKDSLLDDEALQRSTTVYLPIGKISMFPERLSENLMSLVEGKERPTITFAMEFDENFNKIEGSEDVMISAIVVKKRLSFIEAEGLIIDGEEDEEYGEEHNRYRRRLNEELNLLLEISENLKQQRIENGAIDFNTPTIKVFVDENKNITLKRIEANLQSHHIVKEMMILANNISAQFCINNDIPCIFITQPPPDQPIETDISKKLTRKEIGNILRKMKKSEMGITPAKHTGLGIPAYTQATSPIRRYNDLLVHRQLKSFINNTDENGSIKNDATLEDILSYTKEEIQIVAATSERTARETISIERESRRYWLLKYLSGIIGETTTAFVMKKLNVNYKVMLDNTLTPAILVTNEEIEPGMIINVRIDSVRIRIGNISVSLV